MNSPPNDRLPPLPRESSAPTMTEVIPFRSRKISIRRSKILLPLTLVALAVVALFYFLENAQLAYFIYIVAALAIIGVFLAIYAYSGSRKRWWWYLAPAAITWFILDDAFRYYVLIFRKLLPGNLATLEHANGFLPAFLVYFFAAGLCEEAVKATPALLALVAGLRLREKNQQIDILDKTTLLFRLRRGLVLLGPLDGLLMGCAAGGAFILHETLLQYVPDVFEKSLSSTKDYAAAYLSAMALAVPRTLQAISGHMGWAGIFGYFIGLSARYPRHAVSLIPLGYLTAAVLHAFWDAAGTLPLPPVWYALDSVVSVLIFVSCLLKAKQLELAWHGVETSNDSILIGATTLAGGKALSRLQTLASGLEAAAGAPIPLEFAPASRFSIGTEHERYALDAGCAIDFGALFGDRGVPVGSTAEIDPHPTDRDVLGLKNTGVTPWVSTSSTGATMTVARGRSLRITSGTRIAFGPVVLDIQTY